MILSKLFKKKDTVIVKKLREDLYLLDDAHNATGYLLIGEEKACLIDTMMGSQNLAELVGRYTDKPVVVINTHGHSDHIYGNVFFKKAYMNLKDLELAESSTKNPQFAAACEKLGVTMSEFEDIHEGDVIDLGGKTLKIYDLPGHTLGGIVILCPEERVLFTGDSINHYLWMQLDGCLPITEYADNLERLLFLEKEADHILHGHAQGFDNITLMRALLAGCRSLAAGETEKDSDYPWFCGVATQHPFTIPEDDPANPGTHVIVYNKEDK